MRNVSVLQQRSESNTLKDIIYRHIREVNMSRIMGHSQFYTLRSMAESKFGQIWLPNLQANDIVEYAKHRKEVDGIKPQTFMQDFTFLHCALENTRLWKSEGSDRWEAELEEAKLWLEKLNLIGKSRPRTRRPTEVEIDRLLAYFAEQNEHPRTDCDMVVMVKFAIASCRRQSEITRIKWEDLDYDKKMYWVRDVKDPKMKKGNDIFFPALGDAWALMMAQEMTSEFVFPYNAKTASARFTQAKHKLNIENLRFHDLRREGATRLLEAGYSPAEVRLVTGHKTTAILDRVYSAPNPELLHQGPAAVRSLRASA